MKYRTLPCRAMNASIISITGAAANIWDWARRPLPICMAKGLKIAPIWMPTSQNPTGQIEDIEELSPQDKAAEEAMLRLRLLEEGLNTDELTAKFGPANTADIIRRLDKMVQEGLLLQTGSVCRLTPSRIMTSNPIFARVLNC